MSSRKGVECEFCEGYCYRSDCENDDTCTARENAAYAGRIADALSRFCEFERDADGYCDWCGTTLPAAHLSDCLYPEARAALAKNPNPSGSDTIDSLRRLVAGILKQTTFDHEGRLRTIYAALPYGWIRWAKDVGCDLHAIDGEVHAQRNDFGPAGFEFTIDLNPNYMTPCTHDSLVFWSGGYYVACEKCGVKWVAIKGPTDTDIDYTRGSQQLSGEVRSKTCHERSSK